MQVQLCLEIADLEEARFIEYRPSCITWPLEPQLQITVVKRDRQWFADALPTLRSVWEEIQQAREAARATGVLPYPPKPIRPSKPRQKRPIKCIIEDELYGPIPEKTTEDSDCMFTNDEAVGCMFAC